MIINFAHAVALEYLASDYHLEVDTHQYFVHSTKFSSSDFVYSLDAPRGLSLINDVPEGTGRSRRYCNTGPTQARMEQAPEPHRVAKIPVTIGPPMGVAVVVTLPRTDTTL